MTLNAAACEGIGSLNLTAALYVAAVKQGPTYTGSGTALSTSATTNFFPANGALAINSTEANVETAMSQPETFAKLYCHTSSAQGSAKSDAFTLMKNGSTCSLTCTATNAQTCNDTGHTCTVAVGDTISFQDVTTGSSITARQGTCSVSP